MEGAAGAGQLEALEAFAFHGDGATGNAEAVKPRRGRGKRKEGSGERTPAPPPGKVRRQQTQVHLRDQLKEGVLERTTTPPPGKAKKQQRDAGEEEAPTPPSGKAKKLRQAEETVSAEGKVQVEVLCPQCRRDSQSLRQMSLSELLPARAPAGAAAVVEVDLTAEPAEEDPTLCRRCRRSLVVQHMSISAAGAKGKQSGSSSLSTKLRTYKRQATSTFAEWRLTDSEALALMRDACVLCGAAADLQAGRPNGITRLRERVKDEEPVMGMGPYAIGNVATACSVCNMIKGVHKLKSVREVCRTIATHRGLGDFGRFPERFPDNTSRKSRSSYLGDGSTGMSKTHSLSNAEFTRIVAQPCHYCGKASDPPRHFNGLDRLDNALRVYTASNAVSCCGTCNMAKSKFSEELFLRHCRLIASKAASGCAVEGDAAEQQASSAEGAEGADGVDGAEGPEGTGGAGALAEGTAAETKASSAEGTEGTAAETKASSAEGTEGADGADGAEGAEGTGSTGGIAAETKASSADGAEGTEGAGGTGGTGGIAAETKASSADGAEGAEGTGGTGGTGGIAAETKASSAEGMEGAEGTGGTGGIAAGTKASSSEGTGGNAIRAEAHGTQVSGAQGAEDTEGAEGTEGAAGIGGTAVETKASSSEGTGGSATPAKCS